MSFVVEKSEAAELVNEAADAAFAIPNSDRRLDALVTIASAIQTTSLLQRLLFQSRAWGMSSNGAALFCATVPSLSGQLLNDAVELAETADDVSFAAKMWTCLARRLSGDLKEEALDRASWLAMRTKRNGAQGPNCIAIAILLAQSGRVEDGLRVIEGIEESEDSRRRGLVALAPFLSANRRKRALVEARKISDVSERVAALTELARLSTYVDGKSMWSEVYAAALALKPPRGSLGIPEHRRSTRSAEAARRRMANTPVRVSGRLARPVGESCWPAAKALANPRCGQGLPANYQQPSEICQKWCYRRSVPILFTRSALISGETNARH